MSEVEATVAAVPRKRKRSVVKKRKPKQKEKAKRAVIQSQPVDQAATPQPQAPLVPRKIAIIGKAPSSFALAPYGDPEWEVWILNTLGHANEVPRWDRQFELHDLELTKAKEYGDYYPWLAKQYRPVYLRDKPPAEFNGGVQYPLGPILEHFTNYAGRKYLTNTVSLMVALAIYEHETGTPVSDIGMWGVDMAQHGLRGAGHVGWFTSEYARQRPSVEYWIGIAEGKGIKATIPEQSDILKAACIYGYHTTEQFKKFQARRNELNGRVAQAQQREQQSHDEAIFLAGALEGMNYDEQWLGGGMGK